MIAAGAVIYEQLRDAGSTKRMALAATAMSGSLGVVLALSGCGVGCCFEQTGDHRNELFPGLIVFGLTALLLLGALLWRNPEPLTISPKANAKKRFAQTLQSLLPYTIVVLIVWLAYGLLLDMWVNEQTAPLFYLGSCLL